MKGAHLWKRILNEGVIDDLSLPGSPSLQGEIIRAPIIVDTRPGSRLVRLDWRRFRGLGGPFPKFWVEGVYEGNHWGTLVTFEKSEQGFDVETCAVVDKAPPILLGVCRFNLDPRGNLELPDGRFQARVSLSPHAPKDERAAAVRELLMSVVHDSLDTLLFMSCKNIGLASQPQDAAQVKRATKRFGDTPLGYRYHTLVVRPPGARSDSPGIDIGTTARHVCRGHLAYYGPAEVSGAPDGHDRGLLFGKHAGCFYIPLHSKGDERNGVIEKDYEVRDGQPGQAATIPDEPLTKETP